MRYFLKTKTSKGNISLTPQQARQELKSRWNNTLIQNEYSFNILLSQVKGFKRVEAKKIIGYND